MKQFLNLWVIMNGAFLTLSAVRAEDNPWGATATGSETAKSAEATQKKVETKATKKKIAKKRAAIKKTALQPETAVEVKQLKTPEKFAEKPGETSGVSESKVSGAANASENHFHPGVNGTDHREQLILRTREGCYVVEFESTPGEMISCSRPLEVSYTKNDCGSGKALELANVEAHVSCEGQKRINLYFKTTTSAVEMKLRVRRENDGRFGVVTRYAVESSRESGDAFGKTLASPRVKPLGGEKPEEAPLSFKFSGFAWVEHERSKGFGYDVAAKIPNFSGHAHQNNTNFFSDLNFELGKDRTSLISIF